MKSRESWTTSTLEVSAELRLCTSVMPLTTTPSTAMSRATATSISMTEKPCWAFRAPDRGLSRCSFFMVVSVSVHRAQIDWKDKFQSTDLCGALRTRSNHRQAIVGASRHLNDVPANLIWNLFAVSATRDIPDRIGSASCWIGGNSRESLGPVDYARIGQSCAIAAERASVASPERSSGSGDVQNVRRVRTIGYRDRRVGLQTLSCDLLENVLRNHGRGRIVAGTFVGVHGGDHHDQNSSQPDAQHHHRDHEFDHHEA